MIYCRQEDVGDRCQLGLRRVVPASNGAELQGTQGGLCVQPFRGQRLGNQHCNSYSSSECPSFMPLSLKLMQAVLGRVPALVSSPIATEFLP